MKFPLFLIGRRACICATALISTTAFADHVVDQSQPMASVFDDLRMGNESGQTFTVGMSGELTGLRLLLEGATHSGGVSGSEFVVSLRKTVDGVPREEILTVGGVPRRFLPVGRAGWVNVRFFPPYKATAGEVLAFTIYGLSGGGSFGYNIHGLARGNPYPGGRMFYGFEPGIPLPEVTADIDFAFETIINDDGEGFFPRNVDYSLIQSMSAQIEQLRARIETVKKQSKSKEKRQEIRDLRRQIRDLILQIAVERQRS